MPTVCGPSLATFNNLIPRVMPIGDSITFGVGGTDQASYRTGVFNAMQTAGTPLYFVGSLSQGGTTLLNDPYNEGHSGYCVDAAAQSFFGSLTLVAVPHIPTYNPDLVILQGGTNDIGEFLSDAPTVLAALSAQLDAVWALRTSSHFQIVQFTILNRFDNSGYNTTVQTVNAGIPAMVAGKSYKSSITVVDIYSSVSSANIPGGLHPNDAGYTQYGAFIAADSGWQRALSNARG
jgi:lysophospholipase L1-like esterase